MDMGDVKGFHLHDLPHPGGKPEGKGNPGHRPPRGDREGPAQGYEVGSSHAFPGAGSQDSDLVAHPEEMLLQLNYMVVHPPGVREVIGGNEGYLHPSNFPSDKVLHQVVGLIISVLDRGRFHEIGGGADEGPL